MLLKSLRSRKMMNEKKNQNASTALNNWKIAEKNNNDWHIKDNIFVPLPSEEELREIRKDQQHLYEIKVNRDDLKTVSDSTAQTEIISTYDETQELPFYIHPHNISNYKFLRSYDKKKKIEVEPTTSFRTFFYDKYLLKTSLQKTKESHVTDKPLYSTQIERAVLTSEYLIENHINSTGMGILPEVFGCYLKQADFPLGYIIREIPKDVLDNKSSLIPVLSYFSKRKHNEESLFCKQTKDLNKSELEDFCYKFIERIINSFLKTYWLYSTTLEMHQQNLLLELDQQDQLTGKLLYRDMDGARIDFERPSSAMVTAKIKNLNRNQKETIFEQEKLKRLKNGIMPRLRHNPYWNGLTVFTFKVFIEDSCLYLLNKSLKEELKADINACSIGYSILNQSLYNKSPELFKYKKTKSFL